MVEFWHLQLDLLSLEEMVLSLFGDRGDQVKLTCYRVRLLVRENRTTEAMRYGENKPDWIAIVIQNNCKVYRCYGRHGSLNSLEEGTNLSE